MDFNLLEFLALIKDAETKIHAVALHPKDPYMLLDLQRALGDVFSSADLSRHSVNDMIRSYGYNWENTYSPEARNALSNKRN